MAQLEYLSQLSLQLDVIMWLNLTDGLQVEVTLQK